MRITQNIIRRNSVNSLQSTQRQVARAQEQISSGLRLRKTSDDPIAATQVMRAGGALQALEQYRRNISLADARVKAEGSALDQLTDLLTRARELALSQANPTGTQHLVAPEAVKLLESAIELGNTKFGEDFLFGGDQSSTRPYGLTGGGAGLDFTTTTPGGAHRVQIGDVQQLVTNHNGDEVFERTGALTALRDLARALNTSNPEVVAASIPALETAFSEVQQLLGTNGARGNQLQMASASLEALDISLKTFRSDLQEVDIEEAMTELVGRQTAFQAAMLATSRVLGMNLTDYLR